ncbi:MFS general substrate transporter [Gonapodya prolifera JEL478]|uniref:MFS general substrate transporter n=1 Tax=Gonapodya prolifera (strain JEL478) TaxID=1344416 RepID=A0A139ACF5_GONPJ|nr:MFS general substrate transporter [Gonapodya prolifera JEL478]|eukprot:KXS14103.1 MFS general substrate transporter [Gonapodya prolifera JEL478]
MSLREKFLNHYNNTKVTRDPAAIERDQYLEFPPPINVFGKFVIPGGYLIRIKFNRWFLLPAAVIVMCCVGSIYAWSGYNAAVDTAISGNSAAGNAPNTFYIAVAFFGPTSSILGPWMERVGPRSAALLGITGYFLGNMFAAIACYTKQLWLLYLGMGIVGGCGIGITYISPVSPLQKWFPDRRGLASGFAVAGFGLGSFFASFAQTALITQYGVVKTFVILGFCYLAISLLFIPVLRVPPPGYVIDGVTIDTIKGMEKISILASGAGEEDAKVKDAKAEEATTESGNANGEPGASSDDMTHIVKEAVAPADVEVSAKSPLAMMQSINLVDAVLSVEFRMMFIMLFCNILFGLTTTSKLQDMIKLQFHRSADEAALINALFAVFNALGRVTIPSLSDYIGRKGVYLINLGAQIIICAAFPSIFNNGVYWAFIICIFALVMVYGAGFGSIPAFLSDQFGARNTGATHGVILWAWSLDAVIGIGYNTILNQQVAKYGKDAPNIYNLNFYWLLPVICVGFLVTIFIPTNIRDRILPKFPNELIRVRLGGRMRLVTTKGFRTVSQEDEDRLWNELASK